MTTKYIAIKDTDGNIDSDEVITVEYNEDNSIANEGEVKDQIKCSLDDILDFEDALREHVTDQYGEIEIMGEYFDSFEILENDRYAYDRVMDSFKDEHLYDFVRTVINGLSVDGKVGKMVNYDDTDEVVCGFGEIVYCNEDGTTEPKEEEKVVVVVDNEYCGINANGEGVIVLNDNGEPCRVILAPSVISRIAKEYILNKF